MLEIDKSRIASTVADTVGFAHFILVNLVLVVGSVTSVFSHLGSHYPGVVFVYKYIDAPLASLQIFSGFIKGSLNGGLLFAFTVAEMIIIASSVLYGCVAYLVMRSLFWVFGDQ